MGNTISLENTLAYTRRLLRQGAKAKKSLGQNFLIDDYIIDEIIGASTICPDVPLVEIGPGLGGLTRRLLETEAQEIWAVELDRQKVELLQKEFGGTRLKLLAQDALTLNLKEIWGEQKGYLIGNLPYYITSPLLMHFLEQQDSLLGMTIMVQKEVADRLRAQPGGRDYGVLSIAVQVACEVEKVVHVPPSAFWPPPKVDSAVVRCRIRPHPGLEEMDLKPFFKVVKAAFSQRRKTISNSLAAGLGLGKEQVNAALSEAGIDGQRRAETVTIEEFQKLTQALVPFGQK